MFKVYKNRGFCPRYLLESLNKSTDFYVVPEEKLLPVALITGKKTYRNYVVITSEKKSFIHIKNLLQFFYV